MNAPTRSLSQIQSVAVIRLDSIGDLVLTSPFIRELRRNLPRAHISLAVNPAFRNLVECCPYLDRVVDVPLQRRGGGWGELAHSAKLLDHARSHWWSDRVDLAIVPRYGPDDFDARLLAWLIRAPWRTGFAEPDFSSTTSKKLAISRPGLLTQRLERGGHLHEVMRNLSVLQSIGGNVQSDELELWTTPHDEAHARRILGNDVKRRLVAICPSAAALRRRWPIDRFARVAEQLIDSVDAVQIVIIGGRDNMELGRQLGVRLPGRVLDLTNKLTLRQTSALLRHCHLYIGGDTGPMHLAAAAGASVVEISCHPREGDKSHYNSPARFGPWRTKSIILQPPAKAPCIAQCDDAEAHCILGISVADVIKATMKLLEPLAMA